MNETQEIYEALKNGTINVNELDSENKDELIKHMINVIYELSSSDGRKSQVEKILREQGPIHIKDIAQQLNITTKNVSSQLTYLRSDNIDICTNRKGQKFIMD